MQSDEIKRQVGLSLAAELIQDALAAGEVRGDAGLTSKVVDELEREFAPSGQSVGYAARDGRGDWEYWRDHGLSTGALMRHMAVQWRGDQELYDAVGRVHDLDYLRFPHDVPRKTVTDGIAHPVPLARAMRDLGVHPAVALAVLEHAPYLNLCDAPSSRLAATLSAAEDLTTIAALVPPFNGVDKLSADARALLATIKINKPIHRKGRVRVETNPERFVNKPLAFVVRGGPFQFDV
jgi:hypothetical protein